VGLKGETDAKRATKQTRLMSPAVSRTVTSWSGMRAEGLEQIRVNVIYKNQDSS